MDKETLSKIKLKRTSFHYYLKNASYEAQTKIICQKAAGDYAKPLSIKMKHYRKVLFRYGKTKSSLKNSPWLEKIGKNKSDDNNKVNVFNACLASVFTKELDRFPDFDIAVKTSIDDVFPDRCNWKGAGELKNL